MAQQSVAGRPPLTAWQAEILRLTAFPGPSARIVEPTWWADLAGEPPEAKSSRPRKGVQQEEGVFEGRKLVLVVEPTRIDWLFTPFDPQEREFDVVPTIGSFPESLDAFSQLMLRWFELGTCPSVQRLAFGAILLQPVEDRQTGYQQISAYLSSVRLDPEGSSDFSYQINRPRDSTSGIPGLRINRLSKWSVAAWKTGQFSVRPTAVQHFLGQAYFACRLEMDINTVPDFQDELSREQLPQVFQGLVDLGREIVKEGDIP